MHRSPEEWKQFHDEKIQELPEKLREKAIQVFSNDFEGPGLDKMRQAAEESPDWFIKYRFLGIQLASKLAQYRQQGWKTPSGTWDDYWVPIVEIALGVRERPAKTWKRR